MEDQQVKRNLLLLFMFAVAMAYLEAAVVVYLRQIFYPQGFAFPIKRITLDLGLIELGREASTIVMLLAVAFLAQSTKRGRLVCFMMLFGIWDIFYYVWLYVTVGWPGSIFTWDLLFLIPVIWTGPVLAPMMVSALMVLTSMLYYRYPGAAEAIPISKLEWTVAIMGAAVMFVAFAYNHGVTYRGGVPERFPWAVFIAGFLVGVVVLVRIRRRLICHV
jgi:hypothetical protein